LKSSNLGLRGSKTKPLLTRLFGLAVVITVIGLFLGNARADILCRFLFQCFYESPGFKIRVVDKETGKPLSDVHALAEWTQYGMSGQYPLLVAQDAISGSDGTLVFPAWGPTRGSSNGLVLNQDPVITFYKGGYELLLINNAPGTDERARVRGLTQNGEVFALGLFRGTSDDRVKQLLVPGFGLAIPGNEKTKAQFRDPYLNRLRRLSKEKDSLAQKHEPFFFEVQRTIKSFEEAKQ
jgi:hypothetical protein